MLDFRMMAHPLLACRHRRLGDTERSPETAGRAGVPALPAVSGLLSVRKPLAKGSKAARNLATARGETGFAQVKACACGAATLSIGGSPEGATPLAAKPCSEAGKRLVRSPAEREKGT